MPTSGTPETTDFTRDVLGRYICNGLDEALKSTDKNALRPNNTPQSDARPFNIIVIGAGSFGPVFAQHLLDSDTTHSYRILLLEAGSLVLTEHVQNLPILGLNVPGPVENDPFQLRGEVWGLPWRSSVRSGFTGLAYCLGGRSVFFGGWSPRLLDEEMPDDRWPASVKAQLKASFFDKAADQIGTDVANDFINGHLHEKLRAQLFAAITQNKIFDAIQPADLPLHLKGLESKPTAVKNLNKLEAPLAVQGRTVSGLFPVNKFSAVPVLIKASRSASFESQQGMPFPDDVKKRLMVVPLCRVIKLETNVAGGEGRVTGIKTEVQTGFCSGGSPTKERIDIPVPDGAKVFIALGTIESTRMALLSFQGIANYDQIGKNLMAHLRSNLTIRIKRESVDGLSPAVKALQASALFVKCKHDFSTDGIGETGFGFFHHQITAAGLDRPTGDSEAELFKKIPDIDTFDLMRRANDDRIVITIRGIGETQGNNDNNKIVLTNETDEVQVQRAFVTLTTSPKDDKLWDAMDRSANDIAAAFANGQEFEVLLSDDKTFVKVAPGTDLSTVLPHKPKRDGGRRDGMGTTHHEAGPLRMGDNVASSVTDENGRFHGVTNAYAIGPAVFPTVGSPNPMLTGVALARRMAESLVVPPFAADPGLTMLFDGASTDKWRMSKIKNQPSRDNPGLFVTVDRTLESLPGTDLGLFWCTEPTPPNFILKLEWLRWREDDNSGVFLRFPNPDSKGYDNTAYVAINFGFEVQIDQLARDDGATIHKTSAIYGFAGPADPNNLPVKPVGEWNEFEIHANGQQYTVFLNGTKVTEYTNPDPARGIASTPAAPSYIGLQTHTGRVAFRKIQIKAI